MKDKMMYKGNNVVGAVMNVPIFVGIFFVATDFAVFENMDANHDEGLGDVIVGELFLREVGIKAKRSEWIITLYNGDDEVTYQMVRSHPRFKNHTNEQCNKIPPLLKVSEKDVKNEISHAYQKLKGHTSVHEIRGALTEQREVIDAMARDFSRCSTWVTTGLGRMMDRAGVTYTPYSQTHMSYQRRIR
ncbi:hypothetical protein Tco_0136973 [Tanacetum coccineum]